MTDESPIVKLTYALLLAAAGKRATEIWIRREAGRSLVSFEIDGQWHEEMRPPSALHARIVRRLAVMGSLPTYNKGEYAHGQLVLEIDHRRLAFELRVRGHGDDLEARLRPIE